MNNNIMYRTDYKIKKGLEEAKKNNPYGIVSPYKKPQQYISAVPKDNTISNTQKTENQNTWKAPDVSSVELLESGNYSQKEIFGGQQKRNIRETKTYDEIPKTPDLSSIEYIEDYMPKLKENTKSKFESLVDNENNYLLKTKIAPFLQILDKSKNDREFGEMVKKQYAENSAFKRWFDKGIKDLEPYSQSHPEINFNEVFDVINEISEPKSTYEAVTGKIIKDPVASGVTLAVADILKYPEELINVLSGGKLYESGYKGFNDISERIRDNLRQNSSGISRKIIDIGLLVGDTMAAMIAGKGIPKIGSLLLATDGTSKTIAKAKEKGASDAQAYAAAVTNFGIEYLLNKVGTEKVFSMLGTPTESIVNNMLYGGALGMSEEVLTTIAQNLSDAAIMGEKSDIEYYAKVLEQAGYKREEAKKIALKEFLLSDPLKNSTTAFFSNAIVSGINSSVSGYREGNEIYENTDEMDKLTEYEDDGKINIKVQTNVNKSDNFESDKLFYNANKVIKELQQSNQIRVKGVVTVAPKEKKIKTQNTHAMERMQQRHITVEMAQRFIDNADFALKQRNGTQYAYYGEEGFSVLNDEGVLISVGFLDEGGKKLYNEVMRNVKHNK